MPPAVIVLALVAVGVPAGTYAAWGRPRGVAAAVLASAAACGAAQALGETLGSRAAVLGDAQLGLALVGALLATMLVAALESRR